jgi:hypothetical protein
MLSKCISEIRAKASLYEETAIVQVLDASSCVLKSDTAIASDLKEELKRAVSVLEDVPDHQKDWHPGSDGNVLDLVHPSLFPLIYTRSRILPHSTIGLSDCIDSITKGEIVPDPLSHPDLERDKYRNAAREFWSSRFQWLPCNISFPDGDNASIDSYINNLHPIEHQELYSVLEKIITKAVPLWNIVLQCYFEGALRGELRADCRGIKYTFPEGAEEERTGEESDEDEYQERLEELRIYDKPEPEDFEALRVTTEHFKDRFAFLEGGEKKLQVIVKLANIHLRPEKPDYDGGSWHIEGQLNEHIVATVLYYYDNDNITDSHLSFRTKVDSRDFSTDVYYEQNDSRGVEQIFGMQNYQSSVQELGSVLTRENRMIAFPNGFQHRVGSFKLADATRPGHRKILALFLVAPTCPIISTANVPPQQRDWWLKRIKALESRISHLPIELVDIIGEEVKDFPIGLDEAKELREELMKERGMMDKYAVSDMTHETFTFCEH